VQNVHCHAWDPGLHFAADTVREADLSRGRPADLTVTFDGLMRDSERFDRVAVFGLKARRTGYWVPDEHVAELVARAPRKLVGLCACDPTQPGCMEDLRRGTDSLGLKGVKMGPIYAGFDPRADICEPVYRHCQERGLPIVFHAGTTFNAAAPLEYGRPWLFDEVAARHPTIRIVLAHLGHPFIEECLVVIRKHPCLYADVSALFYRPWQLYNALVAAQEYGVTHKLLFGTDYPFARADESIDGLRAVNALTEGTRLPRVSSETIESILARDSFGLLGIGA
jgi:uncharacterized protein